MSLKDPVARRAYFAEHYRKNRAWKMSQRKARYEANKDSISADASIRRALNPQAVQILSRRRYVNHIAKFLLRGARERARKKSLPFNLELSDIVIPSHCPILGIRLYVGEKKVTDNSPTVDRIICSLGYVKGNIAIISQKANRIKTNGTLEEIRAVADWLWLQHTLA